MLEKQTQLVLMSRQSFATSAVASNCSSNMRALGAVSLYLFSSYLYSLQEFMCCQIGAFFYDDFQNILVFVLLLVTDACYLFTLLPGTSVGQKYDK